MVEFIVCVVLVVFIGCVVLSELYCIVCLLCYIVLLYWYVVLSIWFCCIVVLVVLCCCIGLLCKEFCCIVLSLSMRMHTILYIYHEIKIKNAFTATLLANKIL